MKSNKAITITSLLVYLVAMTIVIGTLATIASSFYKNVDSTKATTSSAYSYLKLTKFIVKEINTNGNKVIYPTASDGETNYIIFSKTNNQYEFIDNCVYKNKVKICDGIENCTFILQDENVVTIKIKTTEGKEYINKYNIVDI